MGLVKCGRKTDLAQSKRPNSLDYTREKGWLMMVPIRRVVLVCEFYFGSAALNVFPLPNPSQKVLIAKPEPWPGSMKGWC